MDANGDNMAASNWCDSNKGPSKNKNEPDSHDQNDSQAVLNQPEEKALLGCSGLSDLPESEMPQETRNVDCNSCPVLADPDSCMEGAMARDDHGFSPAESATECGLDTRFAAACDEEEEEDDGDEEVDPAMWDGVIPIEVKGDPDILSDEDLTCEFCSPRLDAGDQLWKRNRECCLTSDLDGELEGALTLDQLDDDALFHIAKFLESRTIRFALSRVCQRFHVLFSREAYYWKARYSSQVGTKCRCPTIKTPATFHVADQCLAWDDSHRVWTDPESNTRHFSYSHNVLGGVDAVHLMNEGQLVLSGDRNRSLNLIDLSRYPGPDADAAQMKDMLVCSDQTSHNGWIWTIDSVDNTVFTGSWDTHIRLFDVAAQCRVVSDYKCTSAVLSLFAEENEIFASCFDKRIYFIDRRSSELKSRVFHTKAVLCITGNENFIISGSEDRRISIFDRRAGKIFMMFKLESYPLCLSYHDNQLWFGDRTGTLHLHDGTDGVFKHIGSYNIGHTQKMTGLVNTPGAVFTCSGDGTVKVLEPTRDPTVLASLKGHKKEVADVAYSRGVLASAGDDCVSLWLPKDWDRNTYLL